MSRQRFVLVGSLMLVALAALAAGCDDEATDADGTPTGGPGPTAGVTATAPPAEPTSTATSTPVPDIRDEDLTALPDFQDFLASSGGQVDPERIIYVDLTEDGVEEAVVPVSSGGEGGDIAVSVFGYGPGGLQELLRVLPEDASQIALDEESTLEGQLVTEEPVYAQGDPFCCPSQLLIRTYRWDGSELVVASEDLVPAARS